jgi:hypothetical protein
MSRFTVHCIFIPLVLMQLAFIALEVAVGSAGQVAFCAVMGAATGVCYWISLEWAS